MQDKPKGIRCPHCNGVHHRYRGEEPVTGGTLRNYQCEACQGRFTTTEIIIHAEKGVGPK